MTLIPDHRPSALVHILTHLLMPPVMCVFDMGGDRVASARVILKLGGPLGSSNGGFDALMQCSLTGIWPPIIGPECPDLGSSPSPVIERELETCRV
jgi:hypothetical protein